MAGHAGALGDVAVVLGRPATDDVPFARLLELAAPNALSQLHPLVLGQHTLYFEQEPVVGKTLSHHNALEAAEKPHPQYSRRRHFSYR
jgi:hypothetical protein